MPDTLGMLLLTIIGYQEADLPNVTFEVAEEASAEIVVDAREANELECCSQKWDTTFQSLNVIKGAARLLLLLLQS